MATDSTGRLSRPLSPDGVPRAARTANGGALLRASTPPWPVRRTPCPRRHSGTGTKRSNTRDPRLTAFPPMRPRILVDRWTLLDATGFQREHDKLGYRQTRHGAVQQCGTATDRPERGREEPYEAG